MKKIILPPIYFLLAIIFVICFCIINSLVVFIILIWTFNIVSTKEQWDYAWGQLIVPKSDAIISLHIKLLSSTSNLSDKDIDELENKINLMKNSPPRSNFKWFMISALNFGTYNLIQKY